MTSLRRGVCPTLAEPLLSGDGYLARWMPHEALSIDSFLGLCDLSERLGNGVIEVTHRGSFQVRGLKSNTGLLGEVRRLGAAVQEQPPVLLPPLIGDHSADVSSLRPVSHDILAWLASWPHSRRLNPKVSLSLDAHTPLHLDGLRSDVRFFCDREAVHLALGGDASTATPVGWLTLSGVTQALGQVLTWLIERGTDARGSDLASDDAIRALRTSLGPWLIQGDAPLHRPPPEAIDAYSLVDGTVARGLGFAFGFASASELRSFARSAAQLGAHAFRPYAERTLIVLGFPRKADGDLVAAAEASGLVTSRNDPRRFVVACAGAPVCRSAHIATRSLAPRVAEAARSLLSPGSLIHLSGCPKGCAHSGVAPLTFVGPDSLIIGGSAADEPARHVSPEVLVTELEQLNSGRERLEERAEAGNPYQTLRATASSLSVSASV